MTLCQHDMVLGLCPQCDDEVDDMVLRAQRGTLTARQIQSLNRVQRALFRDILLANSIRIGTSDPHRGVD